MSTDLLESEVKMVFMKYNDIRNKKVVRKYLLLKSLGEVSNPMCTKGKFDINNRRHNE